MNKKFSALNRAEIKERLGKTKYDILVIGGGITGAGIALDAASRGLRVAVLEKNDYASGTSSRSTKLVHGGLRYLEHLEFKVVSQVGKERDIAYNNAAHIIIPEKMLLPITKDGKLGMFTSSLALQLYDYLAGVKESEKRKMLSLEETLAKEPLLKNSKLIGGALYYEYKTNDSRLVMEVLKKAVEYSAEAINYLIVKDLLYRDGEVIGVKAEDFFTKEELVISASTIVNATGVWTDELRKKDNSLSGKRLHLTKGVHIVVSKKYFNLQHAIYFDVGDGRMVFAIPRFDVVYIGTTDTDYTDNPDNPLVLPEDVSYLLNAINGISPQVNLSEKHIESVWAGLRPLIHEDGKSPSELSRKDEIFISNSGLISIAGGKLTGYRLMAKKVVNKIVKRMPVSEQKKYEKCLTKNIKLSGGEFDFKPTSKLMKEEFDRCFINVRSLNINRLEYRDLFFKYGANLKLIEQQAKHYLNTDEKDAWLKAEIWYSVNYEMTTTISDFFIRRTGMIHFFIHDIKPKLELTAHILGEFLNWNESEKEKQIADFMIHYKHAALDFLK